MCLHAIALCPPSRLVTICPQMKEIRERVGSLLLAMMYAPHGTYPDAAPYTVPSTFTMIVLNGISSRPACANAS